MADLNRPQVEASVGQQLQLLFLGAVHTPDAAREQRTGEFALLLTDLCPDREALALRGRDLEGRLLEAGFRPICADR